MKSHPSILRDFTVDRRVGLLSVVALLVGTGAAALAVFLLRGIALATNLFYYHRFGSAPVSPAGSPLGPWMPFVPVLGGMIVGLMATTVQTRFVGMAFLKQSNRSCLEGCA
jgi:H+/Cl- antiporter ClcA